MKIIDLNNYYFEIIPENQSDKNKLNKFPGFQKVKGHRLMPKKPAVIQNLVHRFKGIYKDPIKAEPSFKEYMTASDNLLDIPEDFEWRTNPYPHQLLALRFLYTHGSAGLLLEPGLGKTFVVLNYIKLMQYTKSLVVCPKALLFVWEDEVRTHRPDLKAHVMKSTSWEAKIENAIAREFKWSQKLSEAPEDSKEYHKAYTNLKAVKRELKKLPEDMEEDMRLASEADVVIVNYEKVHPGVDLLSNFKFDMMALDEGLIKDVSTNRTKSILKVASKVPNRVVMSGTLVNNGPLDIYGPVKFIEPSLVSGGYGAFEHYYANIARTRGGRRFVTGVGRRQTEEIRDILASCSIIMTKDEWLDLPDKYFHRIVVPMNEEQTRLYDELSRNHICEVTEGNYLEVDNALTVACYLGQIANGFLYTYEGSEKDDFADLFEDYEAQEKGKRETIFFNSGKTEALKDLVKGDLNNKKFILWYNMQAEYDQICDILSELGVEFKSIRGGSKNTGEIVHSFNKSGTCQVLICQSQSVNYGITVLGKNPYELEKEGIEVLPEFDSSVYNHVFWSLTWSLERYTQQQDRSHRIGQKQDCHYWILSSECGIEDLIWNRLDKKERIRESILVDYVNNMR